jgi:hypothetical protein
VSPGLLTHWNAEFSTKIRKIGIEIGTMEIHDEYFMDEHIKDAVHYCFQLNKTLFEASVESFPDHAVKLGWKKRGM